MKRKSTLKLATTAIFMAIILLQSFVPFFGNIPLVVLDITILHITVTLGAMVLGIKSGMFLGAFWGICSLIRAYTAGTVVSFLVFSNPIIAIFPRLLTGLVAASSFILLKNLIKNLKLRMGLTGLLASFTNTIGVLTLVYFLAGENYAQLMGVSLNQLPAVLMTIVLTNGLAEALAAFILTPLIGTALWKVNRHYFN